MPEHQSDEIMLCDLSSNIRLSHDCWAGHHGKVLLSNRIV